MQKKLARSSDVGQQRAVIRWHASVASEPDHFHPFGLCFTKVGTDQAADHVATVSERTNTKGHLILYFACLRQAARDRRGTLA